MKNPSQAERLVSAGPTLMELQRKISAVVNGSATLGEIEQVESWIDLADKNMSAQDRTEVYSDAWYMRIEESLAEDFPKFRETVSDETWEILVREYLRAHPSSSYTLAKTGDFLPTFLLERNGIEKWQADLALLEKAVYKSSGATDIKDWDVTELERMDPEAAESLKFKIQPAVFLHDFNYDVLAVREGAATQPMNRKTYVMVHRKGFNVETRELSENEFHFLNRIGQGATLLQLIEEFPENAWLPWLSTAAANGTIEPVLT